MQMRPAGEAGIPRITDELPAADLIADLHGDAALPEMVVGSDGAIGVADQNKVCLVLQVPGWPALIHVRSGSLHNALARGKDRSADRHLKIDRIFEISGMAEGAMESLHDRASPTERKVVDDGSIVVRIERARHPAELILPFPASLRICQKGHDGLPESTLQGAR